MEYRNGKMTAKHIHGVRIDEIILTLNEHGSFFHHHDVLGNVTHLTDSRGKVVESYTYSDFGIPMIIGADGNELAESSMGNRFLFTGRSYWSEFGLYDYRNRVYSAELGRFIQTDPIRFKAGDINIYRYCFNNPLKYLDPTGLYSTVLYVDENDRVQVDTYQVDLSADDLMHLGNDVMVLSGVIAAAGVLDGIPFDEAVTTPIAAGTFSVGAVIYGFGSFWNWLFDDFDE